MGKDNTRFLHKEIFQRVNFLHQAANLVLKTDPSNIELCQHYISTMRLVAEKHVIRISPSIKRTFCKSCNVVLVPGQTARIRGRSKSEPHTVVTCKICGAIKRFMWRKVYELWSEKQEAWIDANKREKKS
ncbi:ribonuclease p protein component 4 [Plakobranchus ocellatus]|uniref:Ribonuclease p protein component 4 n=1 Tax=Plakobranchus ocellatus TaxID=259542 RepID=A0AAV4CLR5_9GAST|nr:ribonuclease p protein component 4 [Plakobranchus ocellatus]